MTRLRQTQAARHAHAAEGGAALTTFVPLRFKRHGVKKVVVIAQALEPHERPCPKVQPTAADPAVVKAIAQGLYWQQLLHEGKATDAAAIARVEGTDRARVTKVARLALLAPDLIDAIVTGRLPVTLQELLRQELPSDWAQQRARLVG